MNRPSQHLLRFFALSLPQTIVSSRIAMPKNSTVRTLLSFSVAIVLAAGLFKLVAAYDRYAADSQWYLLDPPGVGEDFWQSDQSAPLSEWGIQETFASRGRCEAV